MHDRPAHKTRLPSALQDDAPPRLDTKPDESPAPTELAVPPGRDVTRSIEYWYFCETESPLSR